MTRVDKDREWRCKECDTITLESELPEATNPFDINQIVVGCPVCKNIGSFVLICDEPGCTQEVTAGFPVDEGFGGYRQTCSKHFRRLQSSKVISK